MKRFKSLRPSKSVKPVKSVDRRRSVRTGRPASYVAVSKPVRFEDLSIDSILDQLSNQDKSLKLGLNENNELTVAFEDSSYMNLLDSRLHDFIKGFVNKGGS